MEKSLWETEENSLVMDGLGIQVLKRGKSRQDTAVLQDDLPLLTNRNNLFECSKCGKEYQHSQTLRRHLQTHSEEKPFKCHQCNQSFVWQASLSSHLKLHSGVKNFKCQKCPRTFLRKADFKRHEKNVHGKDVKRFPCWHCTCVLRSGSSLEKHILLKHSAAGAGLTNKNRQAKIEARSSSMSPTKISQHTDAIQAPRNSVSEKETSKDSILEGLTTQGSNLESLTTQGSNLESLTPEDPKPQVQTPQASNSQMQTSQHLNSHLQMPEDCVENQIQTLEVSPGSTICLKNKRPQRGKSLKCQDCSIIFKEKSQLETHSCVVTQRTNNSFPCSQCPETFVRKLNLRRHVQAVHGGDEPFRCDSCDKTFFLKDNWQKHMKDHEQEQSVNQLKCDGPSIISSKPLSCSQCPRTFSKSLNLRRHVQTVHGGDEPFRCDPCDKTFLLKGNWQLHLREHEKDKGVLNGLSDGLSSTVDKPFACSRCPRSFIRRRNLIRHVQDVHDEDETFRCDDCDETFLHKENWQLHLREHEKDKEGLNGLSNELSSTVDKHFACSHCPRSFIRKRNLIRHVQDVHDGDETFRCDDCDENFLLKENWQLHLREHEKDKEIVNGLSNGKSSTIGKPFACSHCPRSFIRRRNLIRHVHNVHNGDETFRCDECDKTFLLKEHWQTHLREHNSEEKLVSKFQRDPPRIFKPFSCSQCPRSFLRRLNWRRHVQTVHGGNEPLQCDLCHKTFLLKKNLQKHLKDHENEKKLLSVSNDSQVTTEGLTCTQCSRVFGQSLSLRRHIQNVHGGDEPFECDHCDRTFFLKENWENHLKDHHPGGYHGLRCPHCPKQFVAKKYLVLHLQKHADIQNTSSNGDSLLLSIEKLISTRNPKRRGFTKSPGPNLHDCPHCSRQFSIKQSLKRHIDVIHVRKGEKSFQCPKCQDAFRWETNLERHQRQHHDDSRPFKCQQCLKTFFNQTNLDVHKKVHALKNDDDRGNRENHSVKKKPFQSKSLGVPENANGRKRLPCGRCGKKFIWETNFHKHLLKCEGVRRPAETGCFSCEKCPKQFLRKDSLLKHVQIHRKELERLWKCRNCPQRFSRKFNLQEHQRLHSGEKPYKCPQCPKHFAWKSNLTKHVRSTHDYVQGQDILSLHFPTDNSDGEDVIKPFKCTLCSLTFFNESILQAHQIIHQNVASVKCPMCPKIFSAMPAFSAHLKKHVDKRNDQSASSSVFD